MGIKIIDVKIIGTCSKHRTSNDETQKDIKGRVYTDKEIECIECGINISIPTPHNKRTE